MSGYAFAVDIGGTFTDVVVRRSDGATWVDKTLTTYGDLIEGFFSAVDQAMDRAGITPGDVDDVIVHATTIVTNAIITRRGPPTALLVTAGFRDVLYIRDEHRYDMYDPQIEFAEPLITRDFTYGVDERVLANGTVEQGVDDTQIAEIAAELRERGIESVAVCLLNSYVNPANERRILEGLGQHAPDVYVSLSSEIAPQIREYPRTATTALNAYTQPITQPYLERLTKELRTRGFGRDPLIMLSNGGVLGAGMAGRFPVRMIESGPAAGALVAGYFADILGLDRLMSFDMGGTTAKACLIEDRQPSVTGMFEVDRMYRFKSGSGMPVIVPSIDMIEIGAGGGSVAWVDNMGLLKVGPESAGSEPGPACYGRGGKAPTVTDADLVLGLLDPGNFLGGDMALDKPAAEAAIASIADKLDMDMKDAALGIYRVVGESMAAAARSHATDRGIDYRGMPVLAFGGAGPVHACYVGELLQSDTVIFPPLASVLSALGTLVSPLRLDLAQGALGVPDWDNVQVLIDDMRAESVTAMAEAGCPKESVQFSYGADIRYRGQQNEVQVVLADDPATSRDLGKIRAEFETAYEALYGLRLADVDIEIVTWRVSAHGPEAVRGATPALADVPGEAKTRRDVILAAGTKTVDVFDRHALAVGQRLAGPAIIEERETTIVVPPGWRATVESNGCIVTTKDA